MLLNLAFNTYKLGLFLKPTKLKLVFIVLVIVSCNQLYAQAKLGVGTDNPNAQLDISSSNPASPLNTDGFLISRVDNFPVTPPTALQDGMLIFITGAGIPSRGFYYWDIDLNIWIPIQNNSNWIDNGTYLSPKDGNTKDVTIGGNHNSDAKLTVRSSQTKIASITNTAYSNTNITGIKTDLLNAIGSTAFYTIGNMNDIVSNNHTAIGILNKIEGFGFGEQYGIYNSLTGSSSGSKTGVYMDLKSNSSGIHFGIFNKITGISNRAQHGVYNEIQSQGDSIKIGTRNTITNNGNGEKIGIKNILSNNLGNGDKYGSFNTIDSLSNGTHYGVYSSVLKPNSFAGYFLGSFAVGSNSSTIYKLPDSRGNNQDIIIQTDNLGNTGWINLNDIPYWKTTGNIVGSSNVLGTTNSELLKFGVNNNVSLILNNQSLVFNNTNRNVTISSTDTTQISNGLENVRIGRFASNPNNNSNNTIAIGNSALLNLSDNADKNISIGNASSQNNSTGQENTAVGNFALYGNQTGDNNTAIGNNSMIYAFDGSNNSAIGYESLNNIGSGNNNIAIGYRAGYNLYRVGNPANNNVLIGNEITIPSTVNNDNFLSIGNLIFGNNIDGTDTIKSTGNIGIGVNNPIEKLHVNGNIKFGETASEAAILKGGNIYTHSIGDLNFGNANGAWTLATMENVTESSGIHGNHDNVTIWSPADNNRLFRVFNALNWLDNDTDPFNNNAEVAYIDPNGQYFQVSDSTLKTNIQKISEATAIINSLNGKKYEYKPDAKKQNPTQTAGLIAQELLQVYPVSVNTSTEGTLYVNYNALIPLFLETIKEQQILIDDLKQRVKKVKE